MIPCVGQKCSGAQTCPALSAASGQYRTTTTGSFASTEPVGTGTLDPAGLKCTLHDNLLKYVVGPILPFRQPQCDFRNGVLEADTACTTLISGVIRAVIRGNGRKDKQGNARY